MSGQKGILIVISGFSGAGKGTLIKKLLDTYDNYALSVSATTRPPREGEEEGREYFFKTTEEFERMIAENQLIEYAGYVNNYYGTPKEYVDRKLHEGRDVILEIEIQGAERVKKIYPDAVLIFILPPSAEELKKRLVGRNTESADVIEKRLKRAATEADSIDCYDYIIVNDELEKSVSVLHQTIQSVHGERRRNTELIQTMKEDLQRFS